MEMAKNESKSDLYQKAEASLRINPSNTKVSYNEGDMLKLIHELQVYQLELELQNEELIEATQQAGTASEKYSELYDFAPVGYFTLTKEGYINELNFIGASMLRRERSQTINRVFAVYLADESKSVFEHFREKIFSSHMMETCEVILTDEESYPIHVNLTGIVTKDGEHCLVTASNITMQKQAETDLILKNKELEKLIVQKDKFFSIMAHDLRGPFSGFLGLTEIFTKEVSSLKTDEIQEMGEALWRSAGNLFKLLENLLQWSQMEQGLVPYHPAVFRLLEFAEKSLSSEMLNAKNKEIEMVFDIPSDICVLADERMFRSLLSNLSSNAIKFTHKGGEVTISARYSSFDKVEISIKDTGIGMSKDVQNSLFLLNRQINRKGTDGELSTGLGLFLCKEFVDKHKGKIWVESEEGKGSTFLFTIPCVT